MDKIDEWLRFACVWACFDAAEQSCTTFCTHNGVKMAFKRRNISNGREITHNCRQNRWIIAIFVCLGSFRRWRAHALRSARIMQWKERLSDEISRSGGEYRINLDKSTNDFDLLVSGLVSTLENACTPFCTHNAVKIAFKRRNISMGREITHKFGQNRRMIAICLCLGVFRRCRTVKHYVLHA